MITCKSLPHIDIGLVWAKYLNVWGQLGSVVGAANTLMMVGVFYTTTLKPSLAIPLWLYLMVIVLGSLSVIGFIVKWGISGYYRFFANQSELAEVQRKMDLVMKHFHIEDDKK